MGRGGQNKPGNCGDFADKRANRGESTWKSAWKLGVENRTAAALMIYDGSPQRGEITAQSAATQAWVEL